MVTPAAAPCTFIGQLETYRHPLTHRTTTRHFGLIFGDGAPTVEPTLLGLPDAAPVPVAELVANARRVATRYVSRLLSETMTGRI